MRVLQLCHRVPYPPTDGGSIAMHQLTEGLIKEGIEVKVLALSPLPLENLQKDIPEAYRLKTGFESVSIDTKIKIIPALCNLFSGDSYNIERYRSRAMDDKLRKILSVNTFDIIQLEGLYLTPYIRLIRQLSNAAILYRSHNIEHFIWERLAQACPNPLKKSYLQLLASRLKKYETQIIHQADGLVAISAIDRQFFLDQGFSGPSVVIPAGMPDTMIPAPLPEPEPNSVFHLGSMDWRPNQEGVIWFLKKVWPLVMAGNDQLRFYLAGRRMPAYFHHYASDSVKVVGEVEDAIDFLLSKSIMVVPLLSGGGMRVKIIEGMAASKTIISTTIGAEGIGCRHKEHIFLADKPEEMARYILYCFAHADHAKTIGQQARDFARDNYSMPFIIKNLIAFYERFFMDSSII